MTTIQLDIDIKEEKLKNIDTEKLSFLVSRVFDEYLEELQDEELSKQIQNSREIDLLLNKIKI